MGFYITAAIEHGIPPFSLLYLASTLLLIIFKPKDLLTWVLVPFLLIHFVIGHKELRFLFPMIGFLPGIIVKSIELIQNKWNIELTRNKIFKLFMVGFWVTNFALLAVVTLRPADNQVPLYKTIYSNYEQPITLYCIEDNPYYRVLYISFYKRENLTIKTVQSVNDIPIQGRSYLIVTKNSDEAKEIPKEANLIYSSFPEWIKMFNFNDWQERTNEWLLYEVI